ncbi:GTPase IMAP family member 8-like [Pygocentrus nattereri]|uniref:AIG1-type G domain-containing protein n=1 Tax=Pygocentrus nattereri TaxID=42514 RepID=A0A3B4C7M5_PYGNA|nr:GTPase IMAP family member 8-like [Pygocentrus nattereri]
MSQIQEDSSNGTELRAVIMGWHKAGKTSVINTILGPDVAGSVSGQCVKKEGYVNGRKITLVDTPGWWKDCSIRDSPELSKQAIMRSVSLCPPGPHAFLLVIQADLLIKEKYMEPLVQRMELLSERVWAHTIVLFTAGDSLRNTSIEKHIQSEEKTLKKLLEKCGNRYHVFDNINTGNRTQVEELFEKVQNGIRQNCGRYFEVDLEGLQEIQGKWEKIQRRAAARQTKVRDERCLIKTKAEIQDLEKVRMVLLGWVMSGKSSAGNTILNRKGFETEERTTKCVRSSRDVAGRKITVLDTPGWWKYFSSKFNETVQATVLKGVSQYKKFPHAMLLVLPADTSFKEEQKKIIEENMAIFGEQIWKHTIVLFTWGDFLGDALIEQYIESEGEALQWLIDKCGNRYHVFDNTKRGDDAQVAELLEKIDEMVAGNCLFRPDVTELTEMKAELLLDTSEEVQLEDFLNVLKEEWNRRTKEFRENVEKLLAEATGALLMKSNQSRSPPPTFTEKDVSADTIQACRPVCEMDIPPKKKKKDHGYASKVSDNLTEQLLSLLEREWSRQEAMVMEKLRATLLKAIEVSSEVDEDEIHASMAKVLWWIPGCEIGEDPCRISDAYEDLEDISSQN